MSAEKIKAEARTEFGKGAARRIRRDDKVPAVIYGHGNDPVHVTLTGGLASTWELAWDSVWEHPDERHGLAVGGLLHAVPGERTLVDGLSVRLYVGHPTG